MVGSTKVFRTPDRTWRVEVIGDIMRAYWHGGHVGDCRTPDQLDELMRRISSGRNNVGDLVED